MTIYACDLNIDHCGIKFEKLSVKKEDTEKATTIFVIERSEEENLLKQPFVDKNSKVFTFSKLHFLIQLN